MQTQTSMHEHVEYVDYGIIYCKFYSNWFHGIVWDLWSSFLNHHRSPFFVILIYVRAAAWCLSPCNMINVSKIFCIVGVITVICVVMCCRVNHMSCCHFLTNDNMVPSGQLALSVFTYFPKMMSLPADSWGKFVQLFHLSIIGICFGLSR